MMVRRIPSILPELTFEEALEVTKIHNIFLDMFRGKLDTEVKDIEL